MAAALVLTSETRVDAAGICMPDGDESIYHRVAVCV